MRVGFIGHEYFGIQNNLPTSAHGGFGYLTRKKCEELAKRGHDVHVFIPAYSFSRSDNSSRDLEINGVNLHLFKSADQFAESKYIRFIGHFKESFLKITELDRKLKHFPMDVYQSEEPSIFSSHVSKISRNHVLVFQDPIDDNDVAIMDKATTEYLSSVGLNNTVKNKTDNKISTIQKANESLTRRHIRNLLSNSSEKYVFSEAKFISEKVKKLYSLSYLPGFLPNPVDVPSTRIRKRDSPLVLWLARWDAQKRPDIALRIAKNLPEIDFLFVGTSNEIASYKKVEKRLINIYSKYNNIHIKGFVSEEEKNEILNQSWILLNTSAREGLPISFLEAGAYGTPIVSSVNPDSFSENYGGFVKNGDFEEVIKTAVNEEWFKTKGLHLQRHIKLVHETRIAVDKNILILNEVLDNPK